MRSLPTWHFEVGLVHDKTGERKVVVVELSDKERSDVIRNRHCEQCVINRHASNRAYDLVGPGFTFDEIRSVVVH